MKNLLNILLFGSTYFIGLVFSTVDNTAIAAINHEYAKVSMSYSHDESDQQVCSFQFSPINFCDSKHVNAIKKALIESKPNFDQHYILFSIPERTKYYQQSIVAIDVNSGIAFPLPIDSYSGRPNQQGISIDYGKLNFDLNSNKVCINGAIYAARTEEVGKFCFTFDETKFIGHHTPYMD